jgi:hypothetical protein
MPDTIANKVDIGEWPDFPGKHTWFMDWFPACRQMKYAERDPRITLEPEFKSCKEFSARTWLIAVPIRVWFCKGYILL